MTYVPNSGSVVAFQSNPSVLQTTAGLNSTNASVITVEKTPPGSVVAFQGTTPWATTPVGSFIGVQQGSVAAVIIGGSVATVTTNSSVMLLNGANTIGSVTALQGTSPWMVTSSVAGGIFPISGSVAATIVGTPNVNVAGSVISFQGGTQITSLVSITPSSVLVGTSIFGQLPGGTAMLGSVAAYQGAVWNVAGSVVGFQGGTWSTSVMTNVITSIATAGQVMGSVAALQGTNPWVVNFANSSIIAISAGSVIAIPSGSVITVLQSPSIVGTYAEDAPHTSSDKGVFSLNVRNDTLSSITSTDGDYSPMAMGPVGEAVVANAPITKWVSGTASMLGGVPLTCSVVVIAAQGASVFTYVTGVQVVNFSASSVLVTFGAATSSIIGYTVAPAGGGSNIVYSNGLKTNANAAFSASVSGTSSVYISAQGFISKT